MAKAKENTLYAIIINGEVSQIFNGNDMKEWDESSIHAVEIPKDKEDEIAIGTKFDTLTNTFKELSLEEAKANLLSLINFFFEREIGYLQGDVTQGEVDTWSEQLREAKEYNQNPKATLPLLTQIAKERNMDIKTLASKIITKNTEHNEKKGKLIGYRQKLEKEIQSVKDLESLKKIQYISPFAEAK